MRCPNVQKKPFLIEQVSAIFRLEMPLKYKYSGCTIISCVIGLFNIEKALLDLDGGFNLLPCTMYKQLIFGELILTPITLCLATGLCNIQRGWSKMYLCKLIISNFRVYWYCNSHLHMSSDPVYPWTSIFRQS